MKFFSCLHSWQGWQPWLQRFNWRATRPGLYGDRLRSRVSNVSKNLCLELGVPVNGVADGINSCRLLQGIEEEKGRKDWKSQHQVLNWKLYETTRGWSSDTALRANIWDFTSKLVWCDCRPYSCESSNVYMSQWNHHGGCHSGLAVVQLFTVDGAAAGLASVWHHHWSLHFLLEFSLRRCLFILYYISEPEL